MSRGDMRALRTLAPAVAVAVAYLGGAGEAHAWGGLALEGLVRSSTHLALHSCLTDVSFFGGVFAGELGGGGSCQSSWIVDFSALLFFFSTVVLVVRMRLRAEERRLELARRFVEQGMEPPAALFQEVFEHQGRWYAVRAVWLDVYRESMVRRSASMMNTSSPSSSGQASAW